MRTLARRTSKASGDIQDIVSATYKELGEGTLKANNVSMLMGEVATSTQGLVAYVEHMAHATLEQSTALSQVSEAVATIDEATQRNAGMAEEMSATVDSLHALTEVLADAASKFGAEATPTVPTLALKRDFRPVALAASKKRGSTPTPKLEEVYATNRTDIDGFSSF